MAERENNIVRFPPKFRLPYADERLSVIGRTGSGKTHLASWVLSLSNWDKRPWVVIDYKHDDIIREIPRTEEIAVDARRVPRHPGIYVVHPGPDDDDKVEALLRKIWARGRTGVYVDEGHILPDRGGLQALLTQGRSKQIPVITLTQRPKWVSRFVFSEADHFAVFHLNDKRDQKSVQEMMPVDLARPLEPYHSYWYRVPNHALFRMNPVPPRGDVLQTFDDRHPDRQRRRMI
jgi:DNA helicase HerA-like ATPase